MIATSATCSCRSHWPLQKRLQQAILRACRLPGLLLIRLYQKHLASEIRSRQCRYRPSCSNYAYEAIDRHGLIVGGLLAYERVSRCNPHHPAGDDPVPGNYHDHNQDSARREGIDLFGASGSALPNFNGASRLRL
jgi:uncharacterized protein